MYNVIDYPKCIHQLLISSRKLIYSEGLFTHKVSLMALREPNHQSKQKLSNYLFLSKIANCNKNRLFQVKKRSLVQYISI